MPGAVVRKLSGARATFEDPCIALFRLRRFPIGFRDGELRIFQILRGRVCLVQLLLCLPCNSIGWLSLLAKGPLR